MFGNLIQPSSEHTFYTHVSPGPRSKSLHWSSVNKLQFALWYWEVKTSGNPPLWQHGLRQTMSSVLPHPPSITAPESTCLTVPLSLFWLAQASTSVTFSPLYLYYATHRLRPLGTAQSTDTWRASRQRENLLISHAIWCHHGPVNTFSVTAQPPKMIRLKLLMGCEVGIKVAIRIIWREPRL